MYERHDTLYWSRGGVVSCYLAGSLYLPLATCHLLLALLSRAKTKDKSDCLPVQALLLVDRGFQEVLRDPVSGGQDKEGEGRRMRQRDKSPGRASITNYQLPSFASSWILQVKIVITSMILKDRHLIVW